MCEYCYQSKDNEISGKPIFQYEWKETAGYEPPKYRNDFLEMFILKSKNDKKAGLMIDSGYGYRYIDINYCPMCGRKLGDVSEVDRLFEELGYEKIVEHKYKQPDDDGVTELIVYRDYGTSLEIEFWNDKTINKSSGYDVSYITMQELKAINLKCKELGWIEE